MIEKIQRPGSFILIVTLFIAETITAMVTTERKTVCDVAQRKEIVVVQQAKIETLSKKEKDLLCRLVMAEAGTQTLECMEAVAEVVLNRVDSKNYPDTIKGVIYEPGQFSVVDNGTINTEYNYRVCMAVRLAIENRKHKNVIAFRTSHYHTWAKDYKKIDTLYFSKE